MQMPLGNAMVSSTRIYKVKKKASAALFEDPTACPPPPCRLIVLLAGDAWRYTSTAVGTHAPTCHDALSRAPAVHSSHAQSRASALDGVRDAG
jgi:hypothetical protein